MDPLTLAFSFSTIVSLICNYRGEKESQKEIDYSDFLSWLSKSNHDGIKKLLNKNLKISKSTQALLLENSDTLLEKLKTIEGVTLNISSRIPALDSLAKAINQNSEISNQAISIISQLEKSGNASKIGAKTGQIGIC